jgi:hypothetical protein
MHAIPTVNAVASQCPLDRRIPDAPETATQDPEPRITEFDRFMTVT